MLIQPVLIRRAPSLDTLLSIVVIAVMAVTTFSRAQVWHSDRTLWTAEIAADPLSLRGHLNLGKALGEEQDLQGSALEALRAVELSQDPRINPWLRAYVWSAGLSNFAHTAIKAGDYGQAHVALDLVLSEHPEFPPAQFNAGILGVAEGDCVRARHHFSIAARLDSSLKPWPCVIPER